MQCDSTKWFKIENGSHDGLGLMSYCFVIYYQSVKLYNAGMLTALWNRIGGVALLIDIAWILSFGRWNCFYYLDCIKSSSPLFAIKRGPNAESAKRVGISTQRIWWTLTP